MKELYGLRYDFVRKNDIFLKVMSGRVSLLEQDLTNTAAKMLEYNQITGLLDVLIEKVDLEAALLYKITGKRMLSQVLKMHRLQARSFFQLLVRLGSIIDEGRSYLLSEERFVLHQDFIFVGDDLEDIHLLYLPIASIDHGLLPQEQWRDLILELLEYVDDMQVEQLRVLLSELKRSDWTLSSALKSWIQRLTGLDSHSMKLAMEPDISESEGPLWDHNSSKSFSERNESVDGPEQEPVIHMEADRFETLDTEEEMHQELGHGYIEDLLRKKPAAPKDEMKTGAKDQSRPQRRDKAMKIAILCMLLLASVSLLVPAPEARYVFLLALFCCIGTAGFYYWRASTKEKRGEIDWDAALEAEEEDGARPNKRDKDIYEKDMDSASDDQAREKELPPASQQGAIIHHQMHPIQSARSAPPSATTVLNRMEGTTVLNAKPSASNQNAVLERIDGGRKERIPIRLDSFSIGRERSAVDWHLDAIGISRLHCEIVKDEEGYAFKDLGSKNGSFINGELLVPYKAYRLQSQDQVRMADVELIFRVE